MKIGLALGGGGAKGLAHIGVLQVLEEANIPIHMICGTSIGAIIGAFYTLEPDAKKLEKIAKEIIRSSEFKNIGINLFSGESRVPKFLQNITTFIKEKYIYAKAILSSSIIKGDSFRILLEKFFDKFLISDTKIPFAAVATDLITGKDEIIKDGPIVDALLASAAIPGVFPYVKKDNLILVDGGATADIPVQAVKEFGADFIISVSFLGEIDHHFSINTGLQINFRVDEIVKYRLNLLNLKYADIIISPEVNNVRWYDFSKLSFCIKKGREAALKCLPEIKKTLSFWGRVKRLIKSRYKKFLTL